MDDKPKKTIITRTKNIHAAGHGGSWKVAYADFVTAMMAFFLLMWLLSMVSPEKKAQISLYFKTFSLFEKSGESFMHEGGPKIVKGHIPGVDLQEGEGKELGITKEELEALVIEQINLKLEKLRNQLVVDMTKNGIRIQIIDSEANAAFTPGSAQLTETGRKILKVVSDIARSIPNKIAIEGHTDSSPARGETSNWELSGARACAARRELEVDGVNPGRISRIAGFADRAPLVEDNPSDPRNRRISVIFLFDKVGKPGARGTNIYDMLDSRY